MDTLLNLEECKERKPLEWCLSLNNINKLLERLEVVQKLNIQHFATKDLIQILVEHLFLLQDQEEWSRKRSKNEVLRPKNNRPVSKILSSNISI